MNGHSEQLKIEVQMGRIVQLKLTRIHSFIF